MTRNCDTSDFKFARWQRQAGLLDDSCAQAGMGAKREIDIGLRQRLQPEDGMAVQAGDGRTRSCQAATRAWRFIAVFQGRHLSMPELREFLRSCILRSVKRNLTWFVAG